MDEDSASDDKINLSDPEVDSVSQLEVVSPDGERLRELGGAGEVLARVELDLAYSSEKLLNLDILLMHVVTRENDYETLAMENEEFCDDSVEKGLEFDLLSGILDSEVRELEKLMTSLQPEIVDVREKISSCELVRETFSEMERKLHDSEESLEQSRNQVAEIRMQCDEFRRTLLSFCGQDNWNNNKTADMSENGQFSNKNAKIKMQTAEQQRHILRMLEKSLARELDLEKKLSDSRNSEEELNLKLHSAEQEMFYMDEAVEDVLWRLFEAENATEVLMGTSKELMGHLQIIQFNLKGSIQREGEMRSKLQDLMEQAETKGSDLTSELSELKNTIEGLKENMSKAESRAETAETKCSLLAEANLVLNEELGLLKSSDMEKVDLLEKQLRESDMQLQHAKASAEASLEQQNMLYSAIKDMENLINDLKSKVLKAESRVEKSEKKCAFLSETNLGLHEEVSFMRGRMECLETSLHQADEEKTATAKEIHIRAKVITDLVMQLALERERLHKQMSLLTKENKTLVAKFGKACDGNNYDKEIFHKVDLTTGIGTKESEEAVTESSATSFQVDKSERDAPAGETKVESTVSTKDAAVGESNPESARRIEARHLKSKYLLMPIVVLLVSAIAAYLFHPERYQF